MPEVVYVLTNEAMPGLVKVGMTSDSVQNRIAQLSAATGVPLPFEVYFAADVEDCDRTERILHQLFAEHRVNPKREFFRVDPEKVVLAISLGKFREVTSGAALVDAEEQAALEKVKARRPRLRLDLIGINPGDRLVFARDERVTVEVAAGGTVILDGEALSLSAAAVKVLQRMGYQTSTASGSEYWKFEGESLDERRRRLEAKVFGDSEPPAI